MGQPARTANANSASATCAVGRAAYRGIRHHGRPKRPGPDGRGRAVVVRRRRRPGGRWWLLCGWGCQRRATSPWRFIVQGSPWVSAGPREVVEDLAASAVVDGKAGARKARAVKVAKVAKLPKARAAGAGRKARLGEA